ncbi:hypothetical protein F5Y11DRAFT_26926 [Daldinia sp. FL1419]|nr:hypothetical protein F5Y11DRAFT_26926 [Daldinia sp. FL1419]
MLYETISLYIKRILVGISFVIFYIMFLSGFLIFTYTCYHIIHFWLKWTLKQNAYENEDEDDDDADMRYELDRQNEVEQYYGSINGEYRGYGDVRVYDEHREYEVKKPIDPVILHAIQIPTPDLYETSSIRVLPTRDVFDIDIINIIDILCVYQTHIKKWPAVDYSRCSPDM